MAQRLTRLLWCRSVLQCSSTLWHCCWLRLQVQLSTLLTTPEGMPWFSEVQATPHVEHSLLSWTSISCSRTSNTGRKEVYDLLCQTLTLTHTLMSLLTKTCSDSNHLNDHELRHVTMSNNWDNLQALKPAFCSQRRQLPTMSQIKMSSCANERVVSAGWPEVSSGDHNRRR